MLLEDNRIEGVSKQLEKVSMQLEQLIGMMKNNAPKQAVNVQSLEKPVIKTETPKAQVAKTVVAPAKAVSKTPAKVEVKKTAPVKKAAAKKVSKKK